ncbi:hypothetical protein ACRU3B_18225 [Mycobacterium colombiense]
MIDDLPDPTGLGVGSLSKLRDLFQDAAIKAVGDNDAKMGAWARAVADRYALEVNIRARDRRALEQWIADRRRERPHGTPGDTGGLPLWHDISAPPEKG